MSNLQARAAQNHRRDAQEQPKAVQGQPKPGLLGSAKTMTKKNYPSKTLTKQFAKFSIAIFMVKSRRMKLSTTPFESSRRDLFDFNGFGRF